MFAYRVAHGLPPVRSQNRIPAPRGRTRYRCVRDPGHPNRKMGGAPGCHARQSRVGDRSRFRSWTCQHGSQRGDQQTRRNVSPEKGWSSQKALCKRMFISKGSFNISHTSTVEIEGHLAMATPFASIPTPSLPPELLSISAAKDIACPRPLSYSRRAYRLPCRIGTRDSREIHSGDPSPGIGLPVSTVSGRRSSREGG